MRGVRPMPSRKSGRMHWEVTAGYGTKLLCKDYGDNVGNRRLPAGARSNLQRLAVQGESLSQREGVGGADELVGAMKEG